MTLHSRFRALVTGLALTSLATVSSPAFSADIAVTGEWVLLGDVAAVVGPAAKKPIAAAPLPGQRMPLSTEFIQAQASAAGYPVSLQAGEMIWVTRSAAASAPALQQAQKPAPQQIAAPTPQRPAPSNLFPDTIDGLIPVLTTDVRRGDPITPDMISFEQPDENRRIQGLITSSRVLQETEATRTIRAGQAISMRDVKPVSVVHKGDQVQLIYETGALRLIVSAKALTSAARGETVRVVNLQSNRAMDAVASAPGEARVGSPMFTQEG